MVKCIKFVVLFFVLISTRSFAQQLEITQLKAFSALILKETKDSQESIFKHLSNKVVVKTDIGSNARGISLYYNKTEYIDLINKAVAKINKSNKKPGIEEIDVFDHKIIAINKGEFTVSTYSKTARRTVWSIFTVELIKKKIQIVKIAESE